MKKEYIIIALISLLVLMSCNNSNNSKRVYPEGEINFTIVQTTDIHGMIFPYNFITDKDENTSMAQVNTYIKKLKDEGKTILLLDDGDSLQGQPTVYYYNFVATNEPHIWSEVLNYMNYDAVGVGNHDVEAGHNVYDKIAKEIKAPLICANLVDEKTKNPYFKPYAIIEKNGVNTKSLSLLPLLRKRCRQAGVHQPEDKTDTATQQPTGQAAAAAISTICRKTKQPVTSITTC